MKMTIGLMIIIELIYQGEIDIITDYCDSNQQLLEYFDTACLSITHNWAYSGSSRGSPRSLWFTGDVFYSIVGKGAANKSRAGTPPIHSVRGTTASISR